MCVGGVVLLLSTITLIINFREFAQTIPFSIYVMFFLCVWYKSSADHLYLTMAQLAGIGLQEFARICLYNVIKAFLGPAASA